ncbi:protein BOLA4, chloroplastic/mitochondrial [Gastrolobium bilobum]|uniref:protein BOLA4, chloroplastic/mitochondrial n=1 Tax=Gastrolobium bilobum TaxID=150636 RepID=UPI002AB3062E|nr:protein BOLA4, chloroplastic/mitochondrial [Gastrolobium bilobum]
MRFSLSLSANTMRPHLFSLSPNPILLRQPLPLLVHRYKSILSRTAPNPILLLRSTSYSHTLVGNMGLRRIDSLFTMSSVRKFSTRATHVNDAGSIDLPLIQSMEKKIKEQLNAESVTVKDAYSDGRHVSIDVVSDAFEGQSAVNRQRMVYKAIWEELQSTVHAVDQMTTSTPVEAAARNDKRS